MSCWGLTSGSFSATRRFVFLNTAVLCVLCAFGVNSRAAPHIQGGTPRDLQLELALDTKISVEFELPTDLKDIIAAMNDAIKASRAYDAGGIENALQLDPNVVANAPRQITITRHDEPVRNLLAIILLEASSDDEVSANTALDFYANHDLGSIYISKPNRLTALKMRDKELRIYDVRDLLPSLGPP